MKKMKIWVTGLILLLSILALSACGGSSASASTDTTANNAAGGQGAGQGGPRFTSAYLNNTYENALPVTMQLTLGTMKLEGTPNAVTADQAGKLLPLWQSLASGSIQNGAEMGAVYKQIEGAMTPAQMQAIAAMKLTRTNLQDWAKSEGIQMPQFFQGQGGGTSSPAQATRRAEFQNMSPEARQTAVAQLRSQGGGQGGQGGQGSQRAQGGQGGQRRNVMLDPLIKLLTTRAAK